MVHHKTIYIWFLFWPLFLLHVTKHRTILSVFSIYFIQFSKFFSFSLSFVTLFSIGFGRSFRLRKKNHFSHSPRVWFECTFSFWQMIPWANIDKEFFIIKYIKKGRKKCVFKRFGQGIRYIRKERYNVWSFFFKRIYESHVYNDQRMCTELSNYLNRKGFYFVSNMWTRIYRHQSIFTYL